MPVVSVNVTEETFAKIKAEASKLPRHIRGRVSVVCREAFELRFGKDKSEEIARPDASLSE